MTVTKTALGPLLVPAHIEQFEIPSAITNATLRAFDADYMIVAKEPISLVQGKIRFECLRAES